MKRWLVLGCTLLLIPAGAACGDDPGTTGGSGPGGSGGTGGTGGTGGAGGSGGGQGGDGGGVAGWQQVGDQVSPGSDEAFYPTMMVVGGMPAVGYEHMAADINLHVFDGTSWGASAANPTGGETDSSAYGGQGFCSDGTQIFMAYTHAGDGAAVDETFYSRSLSYRWTTASGWEALNGGGEISQGLGSGNVGDHAFDTTVGCRAGLDPLVGWDEHQLDTTGTDEESRMAIVGSSVTASPAFDRFSAPLSTGEALDVAYDESGNAYAAHFERTGETALETALFVEAFDGTAIGGELGRHSDSNTLSQPSLVPVAPNDIYVAWEGADANDIHRIYVSHWDGNAWSQLGGGAVYGIGPDNDARQPDLILIDGAPTLTWSEWDDAIGGNAIFVAQWDGSSWDMLGDHINIDPTRSAHDPSIAYASGMLYAAFVEFVDAGPRIFVTARAL